MQSSWKVSLLVTLVVCLLPTASCYGNDDLFERYSKVKLLTSCLGEETMARWRSQLVAASTSCEGETAPFIPALLHQIPTMVIREQNAFVPILPKIPQLEQQQQQQQHPHQLQQSWTGPQYFQKYPSASNPLNHQQYYLVAEPQAQQFTPNTQYYPQNVYQPVQQYPQYQWFNNPVPAYQPHQLPSGSQKYYPSSHVSTAAMTLNEFINTPATTKHHHQLPPNIVYLDIAASSDKPIVAKQEDKYRNPGIKYEETEQYLDQQKILAAAAQKQQQQRDGNSNSPTSYSRYDPFIQQQQQQQQQQQSLVQQSRRGVVKKRSASPLYLYQHHQFINPTSKFPHYQGIATAEEYKDHQLRAMRNRVSDKIRNMTCVMRAMGLLTEELQPNYDFMERSLIELPIAEELYVELKESQKFCKEAAQCQPRRSQLHDLPISREFSSSLEYFRCFGKEKLRACLKADVMVMSQLLGSDYGPLAATGGVPHSHVATSTFGAAMDDLEGLLNGASGQFVDLVLL